MSVPLGRAGGVLGLGLAHVLRSEERSLVASASYSRQVFDKASFTVTAFGDVLDSDSVGVFVGFSMPLGETGAHGALGASSSGDQVSGRADLYKPLGLDVGSVGWRASLSGSRSTMQAGEVAYRSAVGVAKVGGDFDSGGGTGSVEFAGSIGMIGGTFFAGNRIEEAFAVVDVGAPGVEVFHQNRSMGRTGWTGSMLLPNLVPAHVNRISIDPSNLPLDAAVAQTNHDVVPSRHSGTKVSFGVEEDVGSGVVILHGPDGAVLPAGLRGFLAGSDREFFVGYDGRAYIEGLTGGTNRISIERPEGECRAEFTFERSRDAQSTIGPLTCAAL